MAECRYLNKSEHALSRLCEFVALFGFNRLFKGWSTSFNHLTESDGSVGRVSCRLDTPAGGDGLRSPVPWGSLFLSHHTECWRPCSASRGQWKREPQDGAVPVRGVDICGCWPEEFVCVLQILQFWELHSKQPLTPEVQCSLPILNKQGRLVHSVELPAAGDDDVCSCQYGFVLTWTGAN